ncbi:Uncharacterised protein [Mycobacteroides abscessus subsp. abscessus]|nr:Uncharacterised protein [Mycobacteroides abscessus subsp. abscessus]
MAKRDYYEVVVLVQKTSLASSVIFSVVHSVAVVVVSNVHVVVQTCAMCWNSRLKKQ